MNTKSASPIYWNILLPLAIFKLLLHFFTNNNYGLHRDEYLYIAESEHLSWGYMEVPPMIAFVGKIATSTMGNTIFAVRLFPALIGAISIIILGLMDRDLGGRKVCPIDSSHYFFTFACLFKEQHPVSTREF